MPPEDAARDLDAARAELADGRWAEARERLGALVERAPTGPALFGLGVAAFWLGDVDGAVRSWRRSYAAYRQAHDQDGALLAAVYLCLSYRMSLGNASAAGGWLRRASSLLDEGATGEGWVALCRAYLANEGGQPREGERWSRAALEVATRTDDVDLGLCARSELGAALVGLGRVDDGVALLDEAMAGALGEGHDPDAVVLISCRTVSSCARGGAFRRASEWIHAADEFHARFGSPHLFTTCRTHYGGILFATGDWSEADRELQVAVELAGLAEPALLAEAVARLAELHIARGEIEVAARLLAGHEDRSGARAVLAELHLARGEPVAAATLLRRRLREIDPGSLEGATALELMVRVELARGSHARAVSEAERLAGIAATMRCELVTARAERALGRTSTVVRARSEHLERALAIFSSLGMPLEVGRTHLLLAEAAAHDRPEAAIAEARLALQILGGLGATPDADASAALLRSLGVTPGRGRRDTGVLTRRELDVLRLLGEGLSNPEIADRLVIARKTVEHHVASVLAKLGLHGRGEATAFALRELDRAQR